MFKVYLDESGSPDDTTAVVVAGFLATLEQWIEFERDWKDAMAAFGVTALHMKGFVRGAAVARPLQNAVGRRLLFWRALLGLVIAAARGLAQKIG